MKAWTIYGWLTAAVMLSSCGPRPTFDWETYSRSMATSHRANTSTSKSPAIYAFGGWEGGTHMDRIVQPLVTEVKPSDARAIAYGQWPGIMEDIKKQHLSGHPIILIGYSAGCSDVVSISNILEKTQVPVGLVLMDATYLGSGMFKPSLQGIPNVGMIPGNAYMVENYVTYSPFGGRNLTTNDFKNPGRTKFRNIFINCAHLNLLLEKYRGRYAESVRAILNEYPGKH